MASVFQSCHAFLFTSLRDSFGSVVLEAMAHGLPIVTLNHQGVGTFVPNSAGIKVPVTTPHETIQSLASAIDELSAADDCRRRNMQLAAWTFAKEQTWDHRAEYMSRIYEEVATRAQLLEPRPPLASNVGVELPPNVETTTKSR
jgi:glycosyltransferase involved in cell wall biosynthesis